MFPYKINWSTESLKEIYEDVSYGYVENLSDMKNIIYKFIDELIYENEDKIQYEETISLNRFYEMVNSEPYCDYLFLDIKYFDISLKIWGDYEVNELELNDYFISRLKLK